MVAVDDIAGKACSVQLGEAFLGLKLSKGLMRLLMSVTVAVRTNDVALVV